MHTSKKNTRYTHKGASKNCCFSPVEAKITIILARVLKLRVKLLVVVVKSERGKITRSFGTRIKITIVIIIMSVGVEESLIRMRKNRSY